MPFGKLLSFFTRKKLEKDTKILTENIVILLANDLPDMADNYLHWSAHFIRQTNDKSLAVSHYTTDNSYNERNKARHSKHFVLDGIEVFNRHTAAYAAIKLTIVNNLIQYIAIPFHKRLGKEYDLSRLRITELHQKSFSVQNPDKKKLLKLLSVLNDEERKLLEIDDTFEIELDSKFYFTILSMEDGNYIAIDKKRTVYRLIHDHEEPAKPIFKNIKEFMSFYRGDKSQLDGFMNY